MQSVSGVNEISFLNSLDDDAYGEALSDISSTCRTLGLSFEWGVRGASIRMATPDRAEPISIGWIFPDGYNWSSLRFLTLGYDTASAKYTPSVAETLDSYVANVSRIDGGSPVKAKTIKAWTWAPAAVPSAKEAIIQALEALVSTSPARRPLETQTMAKDHNGAALSTELGPRTQSAPRQGGYLRPQGVQRG